MLAQEVEILHDDDILKFSAPEILGRDVLDRLYDISDPLEQTRLKALITARAKDLKIESEFKKIIKAYDDADRKLAELYTKNQAEKNATIPLKFDGRGQPLNTIENFVLILRNDEHFQGLKFNLLTYAPEIVANGETARWMDADDSAARNYIESKYHIHNQQKLDDALRIVFAERSYHPIKNIIESVSWDGQERIPKILIKWLKCEDNDYTREVSRLIFSGGINRLYNPGCKFDDVVVLIGTKQGEGKSTFVRWLALNDDFFTEICDIEGQKGIEALEGAWICEIAELLALTKTKEVEAVKSYITKQTDKYRRPFDRRVSDVKRQCVFIGTTNKEQFLTDKTGNRRFYPIKVHQSGYDLFNNKEDVQLNILQCWAEAKAKYDKGEMTPYADRNLIKEIKSHQQNALEDDYRDGMIAAYLENKDETCILDIWKNALGNDYNKPTKKESNEIAIIIQASGEWEGAEKPKRFLDYGIQKYWIRTSNKIKEDKLSEIDTEILPFELP